jgi:sugar/nucleoside kinase (ribokinase family)
MADACGRHALRVAEGASTGKCLSIVSEADAERTMVTDLGASIGLSDLGDFGQVLDSVRIAHFTGYTLLGGPMVPIVLDAMRSARDSGALVSLDVADPFVVQAIRDRLWEVIDDFADIVFLNADEARALTDAEPEEAVSIVADRANVRTVVVKLGAQGSIVSHEGKIHRVEAKMVRAIDTTGAGDAYAGGFLYGYLRSWDATRCGDLASAVAAETVSQLGAVVNDRARLDAVLSQFVGQETSGAEA